MGIGRPAVMAVALSALLLAGVGSFVSSCGFSDPLVGAAAPQFSGVTLDSQVVSLDQYRGKPLLLVYMTAG
jgi:hypothetical protein